MTSLPELVALLYRADWTRLSISAELVERRDTHLSAQVAERITADLRRASGGIWPPIPLHEHFPGSSPRPRPSLRNASGRPALDLRAAAAPAGGRRPVSG